MINGSSLAVLDAATYYHFVALATCIVLIVLHVHRWRQASKKLDSKLKRRMSTLGWATKESETESNRSIPLSITILDGELAKDKLVEHLQSRMDEDPAFFFRFRSKVEHGNFVVDPLFNTSRHVTEHILAEGETPHSISESLANKPLDEDLPLWAITMMHTGGKTWLVWRIHHCIGDGASLAMAFLKLSDAKDLPPELTTPPPAPKKKRTPFYVVWAQIIWSICMYMRKIFNVLIFPEPRTILKQNGNQNKRLGYTLEFNIADTKAVGKQFHATLNDVLVSCIAGALRRTIENETNTPVSQTLTLRAGIPVNMRGPSRISTTSNNFSSLMVDLPVGEADATSRMKIVAKRLAEAKFSLEKNFTQLFSQIVMRLPKDLMRQGVRWSASNVSIAITNVRGPPIDLYMCGHLMSASYAFVPPPPTVNVGVAITSWGKSLGVTVLMDTSIKQSPQYFIKAIEAEFQELRSSLKLD
ncbi:hypothetical protein THRCLA_04541 [Thraustotheca clavata]|uniref:Uncharacterized protein n=1 Tax=Thraustotheca clavata TaxID=74557 RepID=A0A1V9ZYR7_9STRA|nr:hypothetical protein THRCLA_04541 [Thraustotheca clavata]